MPPLTDYLIDRISTGSAKTLQECGYVGSTWLKKIGFDDLMLFIDQLLKKINKQFNNLFLFT